MVDKEPDTNLGCLLMKLLSSKFVIPAKAGIHFKTFNNY